jgi:hypothetical protein
MHEEEEESILWQAESLISQSLDDFPETTADQADRDAAAITRSAITESTRSGHRR